MRFADRTLKVYVPYVVIIFNWTPLFVWYMTKLVVMNGQNMKTRVRMRLDYVYEICYLL